jgi:hypothetical protein
LVKCNAKMFDRRARMRSDEETMPVERRDRARGRRLTLSICDSTRMSIRFSDVRQSVGILLNGQDGNFQSSGESPAATRAKCTRRATMRTLMRDSYPCWEKLYDMRFFTGSASPIVTTTENCATPLAQAGV